MKKSIFTSVASLTFGAMFSLSAAEEKKHVVFLTGDDLTHKSGTHEFYAGALLLSDSLAKSNYSDKITTEVVNEWPEDPSVFDKADVIVHYYKGNQFHQLKDHYEYVQNLVNKGVGQIFIHYAVDPCDPTVDSAVQSWTGGYYKDKFSTNPHWVIKSQLQNHPINNGVESYSLNDEWYINMDFESEVQVGYEKPNLAERVYAVMHGQEGGAPRLDKQLKRKATPGELTVFWAKESENGSRGAGITGAHFHKNWAFDPFRKQVLNTIVWSAHLPVEEVGVTSPEITEEGINANLDARKKGGLKKIVINFDAPEPKKAKSKKKKQPKKVTDPYAQGSVQGAEGAVHPFFTLENLDTINTDDLKIGGMSFDGDILYVATLSPDRTNKKPDHQGKVLKVENVTTANGTSSKVKVTPIVTGLYEPTGIKVLNGHLYVGTKTQILRFDSFKDIEKPLTVKDAVVLVDGTSTINFHTYTVGFDTYQKDGKTYLAGNFTTAIQLGGKRDHMIPPNDKVKRGSTFILGPITGEETADSLNLEYLAGGFRTPNGFRVGPENEVYVADNQGVFNPANEFIRIKPGSFYGHYLLNDAEGRAAAFQPTDIKAQTGSPKGQTPATVLLPQGTVARSPAQPIVISNRTGILAPYNGQILLCEFTTGSILRLFTEEVEGTWQGVAFKHSNGVADKAGNNGFTGGPNRIEEGPDNNYYIGEIGAGRLWEFNGRQHGLQRFSVKDKAPANFNEVLAVRVIDGGFEVEFLHPIDPALIDQSAVEVSQWTYEPSSKYGGAPVGTEKLKVSEMSFSDDKKKATLLINGLKDASEKYVIKNGNKSSDNVGYVVHIDLKPKDEKALYVSEFWYTLLQKVGGKDLEADQIVSASANELATQKYESLCISCHVARGTVWAAPDLKGILGRKQKVVRNGKVEEVTVDRDYIINAIVNPESEKVVEYKDSYMAQLGINKEEAAALADYIINLK